MSTAGVQVRSAPHAGSDQLRALLAITGAVAALAGCVGLTSEIVFSQPSTLKYVLTVVGPVGLTLLAGVTDPFRVLTVLAILAAPFSFVITVQGIALTPLYLFGGAALGLFALSVVRERVPTWIGVAATVGLACLTPGIIFASSPVHYLTLIGAMFGVGLLANRLARSEGGLEVLLGSFVASATVQALIAIWEFATHHTLDLYTGSGQAAFGSSYFFAFENVDRPAAALPDPISLGNVLAIALPISLALLFHRRGFVRRWLLTLATGALVLGLALTLSRLSWVGGAVGAGVVLCLLPAHRLRSAALVGATVAIALALALSLGGSALRQRFESVANPTARGVSTASSDRERQALWRGALQVASEHRAFGTGLGNLDGQLSRFVGVVAPATHAHSTYLQLLAETGAAGLAGVVLIFLAALAELWRARTWSPVLTAGLLGSVVAILLCWTTDYTVRYLQVAFFVAVIIGAAAGVRGRAVQAIRDGRA